MAKEPTNHGKSWAEQEAQLKKLAQQNTPTGVIALKLGRTEGAVQQHASEMGLSLKPVNQSPYNRRKKVSERLGVLGVGRECGVLRTHRSVAPELSENWTGISLLEPARKVD